MDLVTLLTIMLRRWYVVIPVLVIASLLGMLFIGTPAVRYETYSTELLVARSQVEQTEEGAPALSVEQLSSILASTLRQPEFLSSLLEAGSADEVATSISSDGGVVIVSVTGDDPVEVLDTIRAVTEQAPSALDSAVGATTANSFAVAPLSLPSIADVVQTSTRYSAVARIAVLSLADKNNPFPPTGGTILMLKEIARGPEAADALTLAVPEAEFEVLGDERPTAPLIRIVATADTAEAATQAIGVIREQLNIQLEQLQSSAGVAQENRTVIQPLVPAAEAERTSASVVRPAAGAALLALAAACGAAIFIDTLLHRQPRVQPSQRRRRRAKVSQSESATDV